MSQGNLIIRLHQVHKTYVKRIKWIVELSQSLQKTCGSLFHSLNLHCSNWIQGSTKTPFLVRLHHVSASLRSCASSFGFSPLFLKDRTFRHHSSVHIFLIHATSSKSTPYCTQPNPTNLSCLLCADTNLVHLCGCVLFYVWMIEVVHQTQKKTSLWKWSHIKTELRKLATKKQPVSKLMIWKTSRKAREPLLKATLNKRNSKSVVPWKQHFT